MEKPKYYYEVQCQRCSQVEVFVVEGYEKFGYREFYRVRSNKIQPYFYACETCDMITLQRQIAFDKEMADPVKEADNE